MLLQTNSYIVPKEKRAEHTRLMRRFRQLLNQLGCDNFEVYEQVGANWSTNQTSGRFVQIMRFRDRKHQLAVQNAERTDAAAQQLIAEFCDLINYPYQQQQGQFAVGFYSSVLPIAPSRVQPGGAEEVPATSEGAEAAPGAAPEAATAAPVQAQSDVDAPQDELPAPDAVGVEVNLAGGGQCLDGVASAPADAPAEALLGERMPAERSPASTSQPSQEVPVAAPAPESASPQVEQIPARAEPAHAMQASHVPAPAPSPQIAGAPPADAGMNAVTPAAAAEQILAQPPQEPVAPPSPSAPSSPPPMGIIIDAASAYEEPEEALDAPPAGDAHAAAAATSPETQPPNGEFTIDDDVEMSEDDLARLAAELASDDSGVHTPPAHDLQGHPLDRAAEKGGH
jgi:hypothetical protein